MPASAAPTKAASASGTCATAINAGDWAIVTVNCSSTKLPAKTQKVIDDLVAQVKKQQAVIANLQKSDQQQTQQLQALAQGQDAQKRENQEIRDLIAAVFVQMAERSAAPDAPAEAKSASLALEKGDVGPAIQFLGNEAKSVVADPNADNREASALLVQQSALLQTRSIADARKVADRALELDPDNDVALSTAAGLAIVSGDATTAITLQQRLLANVRARLAKKPDDVLLQRDLAFALSSLGNMQFSSGDYQAAQGNYVECLSVLDALAKRDPTNAEWRRMLGFAYAQMGDMDAAAGRTDSALSYQRKAFDIARSLADQFPGDATRYDLVGRYQRLGFVKSAVGRSDEAIADFEAALKLLDPLVNSSPQVDAGYWDQVNIIAQIASAHLLMGRIDEAIATNRRAIAIAEKRVPQNPDNLPWRRMLEVTYGNLGDAQIFRPATSPSDLTRFTGEALESFDASFAIANDIAGRYPQNQQWQFDLWAAWSRIGRARMMRGEYLVALEALEKGASILDGLIKANPGIALYHRQLAMTQSMIGNVRLGQGEKALAADAFNQAIGLIAKASALSPQILEFKRDMAVNLASLAQVQLQAGETDPALASFRKAHALRKELHAAAPGNGLWETDLIWSYAALGTTPAVPLSERVAALKEARSLYIQHRDAGRPPVLPESFLTQLDAQINAVVPASQ